MKGFGEKARIMKKMWRRASDEDGIDLKDVEDGESQEDEIERQENFKSMDNETYELDK